MSIAASFFFLNLKRYIGNLLSMLRRKQSMPFLQQIT
jgi:hypothetical protein